VSSSIADQKIPEPRNVDHDLTSQLHSASATVRYTVSTYHSPQAMPFSVSVRLQATTLLSNELSIEAVLSPHLMLCFGTPSWLVCIAYEMTMSLLASIVAEHRDLPVETKLKNGSRSCPWTWRGTCGSSNFQSILVR
jgi:hypothetical protein